MKMTGGRGVDTAIEAVGVPASFLTCQDIVAPGGVIAQWPRSVWSIKQSKCKNPATREALTRNAPLTLSSNISLQVSLRSVSQRSNGCGRMPSIRTLYDWIAFVAPRGEQYGAPARLHFGQMQPPVTDVQNWAGVPDRFERLCQTHR
jgi:hypothetical protein